MDFSHHFGKLKRQFDIKIYKLRLITLNNMAGSHRMEFIIFSGVGGEKEYRYFHVSKGGAQIY